MIDWSICTSKLGKGSDKIAVEINGVTYHLEPNFAAITHCLMLLLDRLEETNENVEAVRDSIIECSLELKKSLDDISMRI